MGTRHLQTVIAKNGDVKINQYGQYDGYPDGQGLDILNYLRKGDLVKYQFNLESIPIINKHEIDLVNETENWKMFYPYLSRDCGSDIHQMIENGNVKFVQHYEDAEKWCEGFYTIDFKKGIFTSEYYGDKVEISLDKLPTDEEYLKMFSQDDE